MNAGYLSKRLIETAKGLQWEASEAPEFAAKHFRGRPDDVRDGLPAEVIGLRLGAYPVLVAPISYGDVAHTQAVLRSVHSQMVIARTYMRSSEVINSHIVLCATSAPEVSDWRQVVDLAERDENICRKIVWIPKRDAIDASYQEFLARTFLATPWLNADVHLNAPLDQNEGIAQRILVRHGLTSEAAEEWVKLAQQFKGDADTLAYALVQSWEKQ